MPRDLFTVDDLQALIERGGQLVEVLPREEFDEEHIPGAVSIPLGEVTAEGTAGWTASGRSSRTATTTSET